MKILKVYRRCLFVTLILSSLLLVFLVANHIDANLPENIIMKPNNVADIELGVPVSVVSEDKSFESEVSSNLTLLSTDNGTYQFVYEFLGIIPVKQVDVTVTNSEVITPVGLPVGLYLHTEGVMVVDEGEFADNFGDVCSPARGKVKTNDYIVYFNETKVNSKSQLVYLTKQNGSEPVRLKIKRDNKIITEEITPVKDENGEYKLGIWVRDDTQGIGTLTYIDQERNFGALGHGVSDIDTGELLDSTNGRIYQANIWGIEKGQDGKPGGLCGTIDYHKDNIVGIISENTNAGLYGQITSDKCIDELNVYPIEVGYKQEIKKGAAKVQIMLDGELKQYDIKITKINLGSNSKEKNFVIEVVDKELLSKTNGIVQGMSGSPIIQDGKFVGAVTHVFVDDSTKGYGIFIENMIQH